MRPCLSLLLGLLLVGCASAGQTLPSGDAQASWQSTTGKAAPAAQGHETARCTASMRLADGTYVELANQAGGVTIGVVRPGAASDGPGAASISLAGAAGALDIPARPLSGGMVLASLPGGADAERQLATIAATPFRLTARIGTSVLADENLPALRGGAGSCIGSGLASSD